ncbi:hypothetical protein LCGC14_1032420 [marine sediment metagenome]|uniref:Uncharacterized protein n=1 Tax=marine sediment metagenome TaxID=412755 RepID=A0A0F9QCD3_9ZZZZ
MKEVKKKLSFDFKGYDDKIGIHAKDLINSYYVENGCVMTLGEGLYWLTDEYKEKLNKILEVFFKTALFTSKT